MRENETQYAFLKYNQTWPWVSQPSIPLIPFILDMKSVITQIFLRR